MALSSNTIHPKYSGTAVIPLTPFLKNKKGKDAAGMLPAASLPYNANNISPIVQFVKSAIAKISTLVKSRR
jgi:hypothetical protein